MDEELRILMLEDVPADAELEIRELKRAGMRVAHRVVDTEGAFREALREFRPQLIISDFSMPHFDGMWALGLAHELVPDVPFIFVSGTIGEEYAIRALKNGATDYVLKNNLVRLPAAVERAVQEAKERLTLRRAQEAMRETEERFRSFMQHLPGRASIRDLKGRYTFVNEFWLRAFGMEAAAVLGRTFDEIWPSERVGDLKSTHLKVVETNKPVSRVFRAGTEGNSRWWLSTHFPIPDAQGNAARVGTIAIDITEQKIQEEKIARLSRIHAVLSGINSAIVRIRERQQLFYEACRIAVEHGNFGLAWIGLFDPATLDVTPVAWTGLGWDEFNRTKSSARADVPLGQGVVGRAIRERKPVFDNDISASPGVAGKRRQEALRLGYRSVIGLPLIVENEVAGILALFAKEPGFFNDEEMKLLTELAGDISFALEHIAGQERIEKLSRIRAISSEINAAIVRVRQRQDLLKETCHIVSQQGKFEMVWIGTIDQKKQEVRPVAWTGFSAETAHAVSWSSISTAKGTLGEAMRTRKPAVRNDIETELPAGKLRQEALQQGCCSTVCLPLVVDDNVVALIVLFATGRGFFDADELALLNEVAADVSFALQTIEKQEKLDYLSYYDPLTGLPNRTLFHDRVNQALQAQREAGGKAALLFLDLQRFGIVNDTYGRQTGDALLKLVAGRLESVLGSRDYLARIGADTFATVLRDVKQEADVAHTLEQGILNSLKQPFETGGVEIRMAAQAGIALFPGDGNDAEALFRNADAALNKAKDAGDVYLFYAPQMNARVAEQLKLENELRNAIVNEQYVLHYQPRFDLANGQIVGMEALIRWRHPERGMVPPGEFISLLEETGMILDVGRWALRRAALQHAAWCAKGRLPPRIAVNVSPAQLRRKDFVDHVKDALAPVNRAAERIDIEITESMLMEDIESSIDKLKSVQLLGLDVALDDFGTGYSSLSYLARLPINSLKIDRSFIIQMSKGPEQMAIVATVISLARALNLKVVAEGVETEEQANLLRLLRCDDAQGYLFGRPVPPEDLEGKLRQA